MKRFTETLIWDDPWFRKLSTPHKLFWKYLCDKCDNTGVWAKDVETAGYFIGEVINEKESLNAFNKEKERIVVLNDKRWYIKEFIEFQFGKISPESNIGKSIIKLIEKYNGMGIEYPLNGCSTAMRQHIGIGKGKGKGNKRGIVKGEIPSLEAVSLYCKERNNGVDANKWYNWYQSKGWLVGKTKMVDWRAAVRTWERGETKKEEKWAKIVTEGE